MEKLLAYIKNIINWETGVRFWGNSLTNWLLALAISIAVYFMLQPVFSLIVKKIDKSFNHASNKFGDVAINALKNSRFWFFAAVAIFFGTKVLNLYEYGFLPLKILILSTFIQIGIWASVIFSLSLKNWDREHENPSQRAAIFLVHGFGKFLIWTSILLLILDNLGVKVVSLLAGLGVGGIAIALAVQKILGDLFASVSIMIDKPFEIGDFILVDEIRGTVESIGIKTTRIRSINGEQIIMANSVLLDSRISNFKRMEERRITFNVNVSNQTSKENISAIVGIVKNIINNLECARFDRGHLKGFSPGSIDYEFIYWVKSRDYAAYMEVQQKIILAIIDEFAERNISMAYPAQKVLLEK